MDNCPKCGKCLVGVISPKRHIGKCGVKQPGRKKQSPEHVARRMQTMKLRHSTRSEEWNAAISKARTGIKVNDTSNMSKALQGNSRRVGTSTSEIARLNLSTSTKAAYRDGKLTPPKYGPRGSHGVLLGLCYASSYEKHFIEKCSYHGIQIKTAERKEYAVDYTFEGVSHVYFPDFVVVDLELIIEIKPKSQVNNSKVQAKSNAAREIYGDKFQVWTEDDVFSDTSYIILNSKIKRGS